MNAAISDLVSAIGRFYRPFTILIAFAFWCLARAAPARAQTPERPPLGSSITVDALGMLPAPGNLFSLLDTAVPDVIADRIDTGGLSAGEPARLGAHGSTWTQTVFRLGDIDITDPSGTGAPLLLPGVDAWEHVDVATGLIPIDRSAPGLAISLIPRMPGAEWSSTIAVTGSPPDLNARGDIGKRPSIARLNSWLQGNLVTGGPLLPNRLGVFATAAATRSTHFERSSPEQIDSNVASAFVNLAATPRASDEIRTIGWFQRSRDPVEGHQALGHPNAGEVGIALHGQTAWSRQLGSRDSGVRAFAGFTSRRRSNNLVAPAFVAVERLRDGPIPNLLDAGPGTDRLWSIGARFHAGITPGGEQTGSARHLVVAGVEVTGASATAQSSFTGTAGELIDGIPARIWSFTDPSAVSRWGSTSSVAYLGETYAVAPRLTINGGLRFETIHGTQTPDESPVVTWRRLLPRAGMHWLMTDLVQLSAFAQYAAYGHRLPLRDLAYGDPTAPTGTVFRWNAPVGATTLQPAAIGPLVQRIGPGTNGDPQFSAIDPALQQPYMHELMLGFEARPTAATFMRLVAIGRREHHMVGVVDVGVPESTYTTIGIRDPGVDLVGSQDDQTLLFFNRAPITFGADRYLLTNPADDETSFVGADLTMQVRSSNWFLLAGVTAGRSEGLSANRGFGPLENDAAVLGDVYIDPNSRTHAQGRFFTERGYTIKIAHGVRLVGDVDWGWVARYQDGQHFARLVIMQGLNQGTEAVRAFRNGRTRFTFSMTVDTRLQKGFPIGGRRRLAIVLDGYNLLNQALEVEEFSVTGATSRLTSAVQPPRVVQLGARISF